MNNKELINELEKLRKSEEHYRILLDESMDPTFSFYADGTYRYVNYAFAKGLGKTVEEIIGHKIWDIFEKEEADKRFTLVKKVFTEGKTEEIEVLVPLKSCDTYYLTTAKPIFNNSGIVETVICTSKNITNRKLTEIALKVKHDKLLQTLEKINFSSGLLPICASCKSIRDAKGDWTLIEDYLNEQSGIECSHSLCPSCLEKLYGNEPWYRKNNIKSLNNSTK